MSIKFNEYSTKRLKQLFYLCIVVMLLILVLGYEFIFTTAENHGITLARYLIALMLSAAAYIFGVWFESLLKVMSDIKSETRRRDHAKQYGSLGNQDPEDDHDHW